MREGEWNCLKYLKRGGNKKRAGDTKILKGGGEAGSRGGCLKMRGWNPFTNYELDTLKI